MVAELGLGLKIVSLVLLLLWLCIWIFTLLHQSRRKREVWLIVTVLIQVTLIIYWIVFAFSPKFRKKLISE